MIRMHNLGRGAVALALVGVVAGCRADSNAIVVGPKPSGDNAIFQSYVALGNSITSGYQSGGISNATQRQSYAFLLAQQMGTRFAYPALQDPGCPPPVINFQTQARPTGTTSTTCAVRQQSTTTDILNNVAVPGAAVIDPTAESGSANSNLLTSLFLGGKTQVEKALEARPTFASIWIGNNDVLGPAISSGGTTASLATIPSEATFETRYNLMMTQLLAGAPNLKGVLVGVVNVTNAPIMFPAAALASPAFVGGLNAIACTVGSGGTTATGSCSETGGSIFVDPSCTTAPAPGGVDYRASIINTFIVFQIRLDNHPSIISCKAGGAGGTFPAPVGDILVLDPPEQAQVTAAVTGFNTFIASKASSLGFAYFDPNPLLQTLRAGNTVIRQVPTLGATGTFGTGMSLDGVHPSGGVQREVANALIPVINSTYGTSLALVP